jgi:hypothetical protein
MGVSKKIRVPHRKGTIGDKRHAMVLIYPSIRASQEFDNYDYGIDKDQKIVIYGSIESKANVVIFDGADVGQVATHIIMIRYRKEVTSEFKLRVGSQMYDILDVEDFENRHEELKLKCRLLGREANITGEPTVIPEQF